MSAQTEYELRQEIGVHGQIADEFPRAVRSYKAEGDVGFGIVVQRGTSSDQVVPGGGAAGFKGISIRSSDRGQEYYADKETVAVMEMGTVLIRVANGASAGDRAIFDDTTGVIISGDTAGAGETLIRDAYFDSDAVAGGLAVLVLPNIEVA